MWHWTGLAKYGGGVPVRIALWVIVAILNLIVINRQPVVYLAKLEQAVQSAVTTNATLDILSTL